MAAWTRVPRQLAANGGLQEGRIRSRQAMGTKFLGRFFKTGLNRISSGGMKCWF